MDSSQDTSFLRRLGRLVGRTVLTAAAVAGSLYATRRRPNPEESQEPSADESAEETVGTAAEASEEESTVKEAPAEDEAQGPPENEAEESEESTDEVAKDEPVAEEAPTEGEADESGREAAAEEPVDEEVPADDESDELEESADEATALEDLPADELYPMAQRLGITGRATMDQEQLVEALQAEGIHELTDMEPVGEEAPAEDEPDEFEESADEASPLTELTADELYPVAQQMDIAGRATMDQEQLVEALQAEGVQEIVDGEPVEEASAGDESEEAADEARTLEDLPADELYPVAQQLGITGRATMDQEQLVEALQAEGVHEVADGEPVIEGAFAEEDAEEHADEARPLDELTANELYRVAQRLDIAGRSTMRKAQLVEALQAEGIDEAEV